MHKYSRVIRCLACVFCRNDLFRFGKIKWKLCEVKILQENIRYAFRLWARHMRWSVPPPVNTWHENSTPFFLMDRDVSVHMALRVYTSSHRTMHATRVHNDKRACMLFMVVLFVQCHYRRIWKVKTHTTKHRFVSKTQGVIFVTAATTGAGYTNKWAQVQVTYEKESRSLKSSEAGVDIAENYLNFVHTAPVYTFMILVVETLEFYFTHDNCVNLCQFHKVSPQIRNKKWLFWIKSKFLGS